MAYDMIINIYVPIYLYTISAQPIPITKYYIETLNSF